jgi:hypothetical protein
MSETEIIKIKELNPDIIAPSPHNYQKPEEGGSKIIVIGKPGCFALGTKILMYDGTFKNVENVVVGDKLMGPDSKERNVLELCRNSDDMYKINSDTGEPYVVNKKHKLVLKSYSTKNIIEIEVVDYLENFKERNQWRLFRKKVYFKNDTNNANKNIHEDIERCFENKLIPTEYKINSEHNRRIFILSLMYTKGKRCIDGTICIQSENDTFLDDIIFIARSIGLRVLKEKEKCYISTNLEDDGMSTFTVEHQGVGDYYGFTIDGDHRFLLSTCDVVRNTGKSTLIKSLLYSKQHMIPVGMVMSGTEDSNQAYRKMFPSTFVYNNYDEKQVEKFIYRQKLAKQHVENPWAVIILDDCTDDPAIFRKPLQQGMYKRGRHWKMLYILSLQYGLDVRPVIRTNVDGVFILREPNLRNRKVMYENYGGIIPDFKLFCDILDTITNDHTALYIHNITTSTNWKDCVFWYKAKFEEIPKDFKFGCDEFWDFHFERYNPEYIDPINF